MMVLYRMNVFAIRGKLKHPTWEMRKFFRYFPFDLSLKLMECTLGAAVSVFTAYTEEPKQEHINHFICV